MMTLKKKLFWIVLLIGLVKHILKFKYLKSKVVLNFYKKDLKIVDKILIRVKCWWL